MTKYIQFQRKLPLIARLTHACDPFDLKCQYHSTFGYYQVKTKFQIIFFSQVQFTWGLLTSLKGFAREIMQMII
jgi:hypothetical protein